MKQILTGRSPRLPLCGNPAIDLGRKELICRCIDELIDSGLFSSEQTSYDRRCRRVEFVFF